MNTEKRIKLFNPSCAFEASKSEERFEVYSVGGWVNVVGLQNGVVGFEDGEERRAAIDIRRGMNDVSQNP